MVRSSAEETLNGLLDAEADRLCRAMRYGRTPDRIDTRAGSYSRKLQAKAGEARLKNSSAAESTAGNADHRALPAPRVVGRGSIDGDVPGRRERVLGAFLNGDSALLLIAARLRHVAGTKWGTRKYLDLEKLKRVEPWDSNRGGSVNHPAWNCYVATRFHVIVPDGTNFQIKVRILTGTTRFQSGQAPRPAITV